MAIQDIIKAQGLSGAGGRLAMYALMQRGWTEQQAERALNLLLDEPQVGRAETFARIRSLMEEEFHNGVPLEISSPETAAVIDGYERRGTHNE